MSKRPASSAASSEKHPKHPRRFESDVIEALKGTTAPVSLLFVAASVVKEVKKFPSYDAVNRFLAANKGVAEKLSLIIKHQRFEEILSIGELLHTLEILSPHLLPEEICPCKQAEPILDLNLQQSECPIISLVYMADLCFRIR